MVVCLFLRMLLCWVEDYVFVVDVVFGLIGVMLEIVWVKFYSFV